MQPHNSQQFQRDLQNPLLSPDTSYFHVLITCRTFLVQPGEVNFWGQKKFTHFTTVLAGLPPDELDFRSNDSASRTEKNPKLSDVYKNEKSNKRK